MAAVASQPNPSTYPSQLRAAKYSASSRLQHPPPSKTAILALHRYTNDRPSKCHCHRAPASGSQRSSTDFSRNSRSWLQRRTNSQPQYLHVQKYVTAWECFKLYYLSHNIPFPEFSLLSITSFISFLNSIKCLQVSSIKGYISGIQFIHKLLYSAPSPDISNSQTAMLIRGIQRTRPTRPDSRLPITVDILTKGIHTLRTGYQTPSTARTLDTMFILGLWVLRCSELVISSKFDPATNPTISDLTILDSEPISLFEQQRQTKSRKVTSFTFLIFLRLSNLTKPFASISASEFSKLDPPRTLIFRPCRETSQSHLVPKTSKKLS